MRFFLLFLPGLLMAQAPAPAPKPATSTPKPATTAAPKPAAPKPAAASAPKPAAPKPAIAKPVVASKAAPKAAPKPALATDAEKTIYSLGLSIHRSLGQFALSPAEMDIIKMALTDAANGKPAIDLTEWGPKIEGFARSRAEVGMEKEKAAARAFCDKEAALPGAVRSDSGMIYRQLQAGTGESPKPSDTVKVHYRGMLTNGTEFDSSYKRNEPTSFQLSGVIKCWTEGVGKMKPGGKARLICPSDVAYGDRGRPPSIPGGATLVFEVELLSVGAQP